MGAGASAFRKKKKAVAGGDATKGNNLPTAAPAAADTSGETAPDDDIPEAVKGLDEVICRLAQAHPTQTPKRWELITHKLNRTMRKKKIPGQPIKDLFVREGLCIPQCWIAEHAQAEKDKARSRANKVKEKAETGFTLALFGKRKKDAVVDADQKKQGEKGSENGVETPDEAGESDTELESDDEDRAIADQSARREVREQEFKYRPLSKYEVFSFMRRVHDRAGAGLIAAEDAVEDMARAEQMVDKLYEQLPVQILEKISQQNRIKASLRQDSLAYGEMDVLGFLKVMVKLKRVHGHMMANGGSFWDLGAGGGKLVIAAAMMHNFESSYGVECLEELRVASRPVLNRWRQEEASKLDAVKAKTRVDFIFADAMTQEAWVTEATLLFVHTNFSAKKLIELREKAGGMKVGAICLSVSLAAVDEDKWGLLAVEQISTSWGSSKLLIHEKLAE